MTFIYNKTSEKEKRKFLRNNMPKAEIILWSKLKSKQFNGYKFRRQHGIGRFVVDFYCPELKLVIEVDGDSHFVNSEAQEYDKEREVFIQSLGIKFLRFLNTEIYKNLDGVLEKISNTTPRPSLLRRGSRGGQISNQFSCLSRGFTLIELLLVVGILAVVFGLALPFALNTKFTNELDTAAENLRTTLHEAQSQSVAAEGDVPYGVYFDASATPPKYTIYKGTSWVDRDTNFNAGGYGEMQLPKSALMSLSLPGSPNTEINFVRLTGKPPSTITELSTTSGLIALYHFNSTTGTEANKEGKELALGDLGPGVDNLNLKGLWHLNEGTGTNTPDASGNDNTGSVYYADLIVNPGFEAGSGADASNWTESAAADRVTTQAHTGTASMAIMNPTGGQSTDSGCIVVSASTSYTLSAWISNAFASGATRVDVREFSDTSCATSIRIDVNGVSSGPNSSFTNATKTFTTLSNAARVKIRIIVDGSRSGTAYWDDISLKPGWTTAGKFSNTLSFNGADGYVSVANESNFDFNKNNSFSIEAWVKTSAVNGKIVSKMNNASPYTGYELDITAGGMLHAYLISDWAAIPAKALEVTGSVSVNNNAWRHVILTYDGSSSANGLKLYVDGVLDSSITIVKNNLTAPDSILNDISLAIGSRNGQISYFNGSIDEVAVYDTTLTAPQITDHYRRGVAEDSIVIETAGNTFGANDGNIYGPITAVGHTNLNQALQFDGADDYVDLPTLNGIDTVTANAKTTVEFWMYWNGTGGVMPFGFTGYDLYFIDGLFGFNTSNSDVYGIASAGLANRWVHVAAIFNNGSVAANSLYIDGVQQTLTQLLGSPLDRNVASSAKISGWNTNANYKFGGKIDEVALYNIVLDSATIAAHASTADKIITISIPDVGSKDIKVTTEGLIY